jgi:protein gp37
MGLDVWGPGKPRKVTSDANWRKPLAWNRAAEKAGQRRRVFSASLADVFDAEAPHGALERLWGVIRVTPWLDWQILTKRPERILASLPVDWGRGWRNVWLGTSVEDQASANERIPELWRVPACIRFLSCEPLLGPVDITRIPARDFDEAPAWHAAMQSRIHWVIVGGESGPEHRPMNPEWARSLRDQCHRLGVAFFFKQHGGLRPGGEALLDGVQHHEFPRTRDPLLVSGGRT